MGRIIIFSLVDLLPLSRLQTLKDRVNESRAMPLNFTAQVKARRIEQTYVSYHRRPALQRPAWQRRHRREQRQKAVSEDRSRCVCKPSEAFTLVISSVLSKAGAGDWMQTHRTGHAISLCDLRSHLSWQRTDEVSGD